MQVVSSRNEKIILDSKPFASGGEGEVRKIISPAYLKKYCVKIYYPNKRTDAQERKIRFMANNPPEIIQAEGFMIGWPMDIINNRQGAFVGFMMPLAFDDSKELVNLTSKNTNLNRLGNEWSIFSREKGRSAVIARLKLMKNIAIPIYHLHRTNKYVLKDFKPQNVLVTRTGSVTIVDMDSVQIVDNNKLLFPATVATPEYTPPEAYSHKIGVDPKAPLDKSWDYFAFSVVFYQILFGLHPYVVTPKRQTDDSSNTIQSSISKNLFPFGANSLQVAGYPELHDNFHKLPQPIKKLFIRSFSADRTKRPGADEWGKIIDEIVKKAPNVPDMKVKPSKANGGKKEPTQPVTPPRIRKPNYRVLAIVAIIAFFPLGIPALICSNKAETAYENGDYKKAKNLVSVTITLSFIALFIGYILIIYIVELLGF